MDFKSHEHCDNCVKLYCNSPNGCKMLFCEFGCGAQFHSCKMKDHQNVCQKCRIPCINSEYGCPVVLTRDNLRKHLQRCPASVIFCTMEWNRYPVYSKSRLSWVPFFQPNPILVKGHLDVELAFRDQRILREVFRRRCRKGKAKVDMLRSSLQKDTPKQHGNGTQPPTVKSDSVKMAMALAMSSLENKFRKQRGEGENSGRDLENENLLNSETHREDRNILCNLFSGSEKQENVNSNVNPVEIELHPLEVEEDESIKHDEASVSFLNNSVPPPPAHLPIYLDQPLGLNVVVETLPKFQKQFPMYSIPCNQVFRRDEYSGHFKNVHSDIQGGLNGWLEHRCPLSQYGCTFVRYRLLPHSQDGAVTFNQELGSFGIRPYEQSPPVDTSCCAAESSQSQIGDTNGSTGEIAQNQIQMHAKSSLDLLTSLPLEILEKVAGQLDGFSLCNFSRTCKLLREVCRNVLETKGMVLFEWEKRIYDDGSWSWKIRQKRWYFSTSFSPVEKWVHSNSPFMAAHLEKCQYFDHRIPSSQFSYCFIVKPEHSGNGNNENHKEKSEIGLEHHPDHEDSGVDQIVLECKISDENETDTETETDTEISSSSSDSEVLDAKN
ncbi:F-box only protein 40-like [Stylophora pistillata]|uniref:F-box only protein 30 n=1 Tax=Stylophora pistillata TaxID=50429 RepID=A0A2B4S4R4_STYPI|nr:F-box only protein 40-like [Stylophora pistillata]PFX24386.1 F-box only protein 30 [Stylophora pistillata]